MNTHIFSSMILFLSGVLLLIADRVCQALRTIAYRGETIVDGVSAYQDPLLIGLCVACFAAAAVTLMVPVLRRIFAVPVEKLKTKGSKFFNEP